MPLLPGRSRKTISRNIRTEMHSGHLTAKGRRGKQRQAVAIAMRTAGMARKRRSR